MRFGAALIAMLVAGGAGCERDRSNNLQPTPTAKPAEGTPSNRDNTTTRSTGDYPPGDERVAPATPTPVTGNAPGTNAPGMPHATGEQTSGTGTTTTDAMGTPASGAPGDVGVRVKGKRRGTTQTFGSATDNTQPTMREEPARDAKRR